MQDMNVPQSRSRISLAPSMVKGCGTKKGMMRKSARKAYEGEGMFDVLKAVGKEVAPIAIDLASEYAKKKLSGGMSMPLNMSAAQKRTLKKGGAITIKPEMVMEDAKQALAMLPATAKKVLQSLSKNKGIRVALKQGEDVIDRMTGKGLFDVLKAVGKEVAPIAIDVASQYAKKKVSGEGVFDVLKAVGKEVAPLAIDVASQYAKKKVSGGSMKRVKVMNGCGSPYVSAPYKQVMENYTEGGSFLPAGGAGIYPAGKYGGMMMSGCGMPIQLGTPYASMNSPAMHPFMPTHGIQSYNPIGKRSKQGGGPIGSVLGQVLGSMLPI
jgi:hypothetical protein